LCVISLKIHFAFIKIMPAPKRQKSKRSFRKRRPGPNSPTISYGKGELTTLSSTSAIGATVTNTFLFSTDFDGRWTDLSTNFQRWRIVWLKIKFVSQLSTANNGRVAFGVIADPDGTSPTTFIGLAKCRCYSECAGRGSTSIYYKPQSEAWLWCKDLSLNEDRLEYPGFLQVMTGSFTAAGVPGYFVTSYCVEFKEPCSSESQLSEPRIPWKMPKPIVWSSDIGYYCTLAPGSFARNHYLLKRENPLKVKREPEPDNDCKPENDKESKCVPCTNPNSFDVFQPSVQSPPPLEAPSQDVQIFSVKDGVDLELTKGSDGNFVARYVFKR